MRVRVKFRYDPSTGQVSYFQVDDVTDAPLAVDHDATHDRITAEIANVIERGALIDEVMPSGPAVPLSREDTTAEPSAAERQRSRDA
jgi:hypothetical protein